MKQKTVVYKNVNGAKQLKIEIDKEHSIRTTHERRDKDKGWYVHEVVLDHLSDYLVVYRQD